MVFLGEYFEKFLKKKPLKIPEQNLRGIQGETTEEVIGTIPGEDLEGILGKRIGKFLKDFREIFRFLGG